MVLEQVLPGVPALFQPEVPERSLSEVLALFQSEVPERCLSEALEQFQPEVLLLHPWFHFPLFVDLLTPAVLSALLYLALVLGFLKLKYICT